MHNRRAFTLVELLIVIIIIAILVAMAIPYFQKTTDKAKAAEAQGNIGALKRAQTLYYPSGSIYAEEVQDLLTFGGPGDRVTRAFVYGTTNQIWGSRNFTVAAHTNTGTIAAPQIGAPHYHMHENGDIVKTDAGDETNSAESHNHNDGLAPHAHKLPES